MINGKRVLGLIPARGGSKGLPGKNIRSLKGKPLIAWTFEESKKSQYLDTLIVSTDSAEIAEVSRNYQIDVPFIRPADLATDDATSMDVIMHAVEFLEGQGQHYAYLVFLEPTSPLRIVGDIDDSLEKLEGHPSAKSIVGVCQLEADHPEFAVKLTDQDLIKPYLGGDIIMSKRRQELETAYFLEGTIYISDIAYLKETKTFYHQKTMVHPVERHRSYEVDEESDLYMIESLLNYMGRD